MISIDNALNRNGHIIEWARLEGRSLTELERNIIFGVRKYALETMNMTKKFIQALEMEGERDKAIVYQPIRVKLKFAFYNSGEYPWNPQPDYHIIESNHPLFPVGGNVSKSDIEKYDIKIPKTPSFEEWDRKGRPLYRG